MHYKIKNVVPLQNYNLYVEFENDLSKIYEIL